MYQLKFVRFRLIEQKVNFVENYKCVHGENTLELVDIGYPSEWYYIDKRNYKPVCYYFTDEELRKVL